MGAAVDQWGPLVTRAPAVSAGTSRLMWGSKTVGSGEWYLTVQSADPLRTVEYHSPLPTPLGCQVPLPTPHSPRFYRYSSAAVTIRACSAACAAGYPSAGLERSGRPTSRTATSGPTSSRSCGFMNFWGPMLRGSSCTQTISATLG